jgi:isopenicillin-N epimerase
MKQHWTLDPSITFLNHGSYGATPKAVLAKQDEFRARMEREPVLFLSRELEPLLDAVRRDFAAFVGASSEDLAFVANATAAVNGVLRSLKLSANDDLLVTNHEYNASNNALNFVAERSGARVKVVDIPFPVKSPDEIVERIVSGATTRTRLLLIDHITSQSALILPVQRIVAEMNALGIDTLIDGAHGPGQVPLDLEGIGAAYYTGNLHKWVCAPKGAAILYVRTDKRADVRPIAISHGANSSRSDRSRFHIEFDWTGTFDPTPWLAAGEALRFMPALVDGGWPEIMRRNHALALRARDILCDALQIDKPAPDDMIGAMASVPLPDGTATVIDPQSGDPIQNALWDRHKIEVPVMIWPSPPKRILRVSAQLYNTIDEYESLASAIRQLA